MNPFGFEFKPLTVYLGLGILSFIFCIGFLLFLNRYYVISNGFISDLYCESVVKVASSEKIAYATTVDREVNHRYYESYDGGITWQQVVTVPESLEDNLSPVIYRGFEPVCRPDNQHVCYRILPLDRAEESSPEFPTTLEQSSDGGGNWQSAHLPFPVLQ
jgi:hypothetical protein